MTSIFSRIIAGELPGRFVWRDDVCVAFLSIAPLRAGHTLVVPIEEVDQWLDLSPATLERLLEQPETPAAYWDQRSHRAWA